MENFDSRLLIPDIRGVPIVTTKLLTLETILISIQDELDRKGVQARKVLRGPFHVSDSSGLSPYATIWPGSETRSSNRPPQDDTSIFKLRAAAAESFSTRIPETTIEPRRPGKTRLGLPITLHSQDVLATVLACADTGADVNIMSDEVAKILGYLKYDELAEKKQFTLANGQLVEAIGQIESVCSFGTETDSLATMTCVFYILLKAVTPIIMGLDFLEQTKTMTEHRDRLVRVPRPAYQALSVCSLNKPRRLLTCELDSKHTLATPDSGSEIDLMSPSFASERGLKVYPGKEIIELADGSMSVTTGFVRTNLAIIPTDVPYLSTTPRSYVTVDFFLLESLSHDLIIGEDSLEQLQVFTNHQSALVCLPDGSGPLGLNRIRHRGAIDLIISWIKKKIKGSDSSSNSTYISRCKKS
ncbi:hypothetical protein AA0113_g4463 [Alternaria arborescens]|uniref:Uncharacterized protein n=1 Tax=Alternaria arborescens TaxID=156630 RepID=A0A4Q4SAQ6_9PLEO|nr:hypothetical protein AA0113_g4463 [Alternaria arborescens]